MITFNSRITKKGNLEVSPQVLEILGLSAGDNVSVTLDADIFDEVKIPPEILKEAGIDESRGLDIYTDDGCVIISEAECCDE